jgi:hypothetical protein
MSIKKCHRPYLSEELKLELGLLALLIQLLLCMFEVSTLSLYQVIQYLVRRLHFISIVYKLHLYSSSKQRGTFCCTKTYITIYII